MKLVKLSLAAITVASLSVNAFAADSLQGMFKNGKASGQLKAYYFSQENKSGKSGSVFTPGAVLNFKTDSLDGISGALTLQGNSAPFTNEDGKSLYNGDEYGSGAVLSQAYIAYKNSGAFLKVGRQFVSTPLVAGSGSRITKQAYEGYVAGYTGLPDTVIAGGYITKFQNRTDKNGHIATFVNDLDAPGYKDGAWTLFVVNKSVPGLKVTVAYADVIGTNNPNKFGDYKLWYGDLNYHIVMDDVTVRTGVNYYKGQTDDNFIDSNAYSVMLGANMSGLDAEVAYGVLDDAKNGIVYGLGGSAGPGRLYSNTIGFNHEIKGSAAGQSNLAIDLGYDLGKVGVKGAKVAVAYNDFSGATNKTAHPDFNEYTATASYKFSGSLKGLKTVAQYESDDISYDVATTNITNPYQLRLKAIYSF